ncbi:MAG: sulfide/dihydroorotate dehydrogenase-like FAD/NAD-binding protein [Deltaproteobacteria bacterium]|nr:sulfide/dihydroorotate dehydrogenase-like FAD/NAD-binding protein [Deltaproteobacteria bacterium]
MFEILKKTMLSDSVCRMEIDAPDIAHSRKPGQFVILMADDNGERIPLTIADASPEQGTITIIYQIVGLSTRLFASLNVGDGFAHIVGPLGQPTHIHDVGSVVCVGGGIGTAPLYPITKALQEQGSRITSIIGARSRDLIILEDEMGAASEKILVATDDGSYGRKGFVTDLLKLELDAGSVDMVFAIGPLPMMRAVSTLTEGYGVSTLVSLNSIMIDGTGMCGGCRVTVGGEVKFTCVDGPEFDGHKVDFDELGKRLNTYRAEECASSGKGRCILKAGC